MKTILEHLETLPEPYRTQAIENCKNLSNTSKDRTNNVMSAIVMAFDWAESPEGSGYWQRYWYSLTL